jgi:alcohol dehydrogenase class IV
MRQREYVGYNTINHLESTLKEFSVRKLFLVRGKSSYEKCGAKEILDRLFSNYEVESFSQFDRNPKLEDLNRGIEIFNQADSDLVVALGGGSVIDMAKMINFFGCNKLSPRSYVTQENTNVTRKSKPLIAIPTTIGSGSEATHFAAIYIGHKKFSVAHEYILPNIAIVDPQFTASLPSEVAASSVMDALSQAIESYWSVNSNRKAKKFAREAILLIVPNLVSAVNCPDNTTQAAIAKAAHLAGKAINLTMTTAPHAVSYPLTSFFDIPHGHAVALTLPSFLIYNYNVTCDDVLHSRGVDYVKKTILEIAGFLGQNSAEGAKLTLEGLMHEIGLETQLSSFGIKSKSAIETIIENGFTPDRVSNNPRRLTEDSLRKILYGIATPRGVQK